MVVNGLERSSVGTSHAWRVLRKCLLFIGLLVLPPLSLASPRALRTPNEIRVLAACTVSRSAGYVVDGWWL